MRELGRKAVTVWLDSLDADAVENAAGSLRMPTATFVRRAAVLIATRMDSLSDEVTGRSAEQLLGH